MFRVELRIAVLLLISACMGGCVAAVATGAVTGASVAHDKRTTGTVVEDEAIELKAVRAFFRDEELNSQAHINVTSYNMIVLLSGEAPTEELRARAVELVRTIPKVRHVHNEIILAAPSSLMSRSSDTVITSKVKTKLLASKVVDGVNTKIVTENGVVFLMGLKTRAEAEAITEIARQTGGVQKVVKLFEYSD